MAGGSPCLVPLPPIGAQQLGTQGKEEFLEAAAILEALAQEGDEFFGDVHAAAAFALGEGKDPGRMFVAAGAGGAAFADAGFFDKCQGTFQGWPEGGEVVGPAQLEGVEVGDGCVHVVCICSSIPTLQAKNEEKMILFGSGKNLPPRH